MYFHYDQMEQGSFLKCRDSVINCFPSNYLRMFSFTLVLKSQCTFCVQKSHSHEQPFLLLGSHRYRYQTPNTIPIDNWDEEALLDRGALGLQLLMVETKLDTLLKVKLN